MSFTFKHVSVEDLNCKGCPLNTKKQQQLKFDKLDSNLIYTQTHDTFRYLIVLDVPPSTTQLQLIQRHLSDHEIYSYDIYSAVRCKIQTLDEIPIQDVFEKCGLKINYSKYIAAITFGRGMFAVMETTDDFNGWNDFAEYIFNQTYFYSPIYHKTQIKVFPLPPLNFIDHKVKDSFEGFFIDHQLKLAQNCKDENAFRFKPVETIVVDEPNIWLKQRIESDQSETLIALDTETNSLNVYKLNFEIGPVIISYDDKTSYILRFKDIDKELFNQYLNTKKLIGANIKYDISALVRCGIDRECLHISDDILILYHMLNTHAPRIGLKTQSWFIGAGGYDKELDDYKHKFEHLLLEDQPKNRYKVIEYNFGEEIKKESEVKKKKPNINYLKIPEKILFKYAGYDSALTFRLRNYLLKNSQKSVIDAYYKYLVPCLDTFIDMEIDGIPFNAEEAKALMSKLEIEMDQLNIDIKSYFESEFEKAGLDKKLLSDFEISSDEKLATAIEKLKWEKYVLTDKGRISTGEENLIYWKKDGHEIVDKILDYRGKASLCHTHLSGWLNAISEFDGVCHPNFNPGRADTLRTTHSKPNAANIPAHGISAKLIRPLFFKDQIVFEYDYSGFQLRIMAEYSQDPEFLRVYTRGSEGDLHSTSGTFLYFRNTIDEKEFYDLAKQKIEPYKTYRFRSKIFNFSLIFSDNYGVLISTIKKDWSEEDIMSYFTENSTYISTSEYIYVGKRNPDGVYIRTNTIDYIATVSKIIWLKYFEKYVGVHNYIKNQHKIAISQGYVNGYFGTKRHLPELKHKGERSLKKLINELKNISVNSDIQSFEALYMYEALTNIRKELRSKNLHKIVKLRLVTHDSITGTLPLGQQDLIPFVNDIFQKHMAVVNKHTVDFLIEGDFTLVWKDDETKIAGF